MRFESMSGKRIRLTAETRMKDYLPGDEGIVLVGPRPLTGDERYFLVRMDRDGPEGEEILLAEEEIEPVV